VNATGNTPPNFSESVLIGDNNGIVFLENNMELKESDFSTDGQYFIVFCTRGSARFEYDGEQMIMTSDDIMVHILSHGVIRNFSTSPDFRCHQIWFKPNEVQSIRRLSIETISHLFYLKRSPMIHLTEDKSALFRKYFHLFARRMRDQYATTRINVARSILNTIILELLSAVHGLIKDETSVDISINPNAGARERFLTETFMLMVEQNDGHIRKVSYFASQMCLSPQYLSEILYQTIGQRPQDIIRYFTIKAIERRLLYTSMTMQEITEDIGFPNSSFLGRYFKKYTGMTPMKYRKTGKVKL